MDDPLTQCLKRLLLKLTLEDFMLLRDELPIKIFHTKKLFLAALKIVLYDVLKEHDGNIRKCARNLNISYQTIYRMLEEKREEERKAGKQNEKK